MKFVSIGVVRRSAFSIGMGLSIGLSLFAQTPPQTRVSESELSRQNMAQVAASVGQIVAILHRDPGLMVELKRWIAKDATDHGQLISESDLTDEAILDRLENDISFRSEATDLLQKYGYLQPNVNPESTLAKEQELLMRERVRWLAQQEEQDRARSQNQRTAQQRQACDQDGNCTRQNATSSRQTLPRQQPGQNQVPAQGPDQETLPSNPSIRPSNQSTAKTEH